MVATRLDQSVALVGQAINALNFLRRSSVLSNLTKDDDKAMDLMVECQEDIAEEPEELFGHETKQTLTHEAKSEGLKLDAFITPKANPRPNGGQRI